MPGLYRRPPQPQQRLRRFTSSPVGESTVTGSFTANAIVKATRASARSYQDIVLVEGPTPISHWSLGEAPASSTAVDGPGSSDGTYVGSPTLGSTGIPGGGSDTAMTLTGSGSAYVSTALGTAPAPPASVGAWIRHNGTDFTIDTTVAGGATPGVRAIRLMAFASGSSITIGIYTENGNANYVWTATDTHLHYIVGTINPSGDSARIFFDGVEQGVNHGIVYAGGAMSVPFHIGTGTDAGTIGSESWPGLIDEVSLYNVELSADLILKNYHAGITGRVGTGLTADASIVRTITGSLTADATKRATISGSFTANADIKQFGRPGSLTADAIKRSTPTGSLTANATIRRTQTGSLTANATIRRTQTGSLTANAVVFRTQTGSLTANAVIFKAQTGSLTANAVLLKAAAGSLTADAVKLKAITATFTADAEIVAGEVVGAVWTTPVDTVQIDSLETLAFTMPESSPGTGMHFEIQLDMVDTFDGGDLRLHKSHLDLTGWEYWDGGGWEPVPQEGVPVAFVGNEARYTLQTPLDNGTWYRRVRGGAI